jgi:hypothetical protein
MAIATSAATGIPFIRARVMSISAWMPRVIMASVVRRLNRFPLRRARLHPQKTTGRWILTR